MARRTFVFQLYQSKRLRHLHSKIDLAAQMYNHVIAVQKRYYRRFHVYIGRYSMQRQMTKLKRWRRFAHWKNLDAQTVQNIIWRIDQGYQKFFRKENRRPPTFRKRVRYHSITLSQTGWRYDGANRLWLFGRLYRFHHSRDLEGIIKTVTIKRLPTGRMVISFSCLCEDEPIVRIKTGQTAGFDFGLTQFLTGHNGHDVAAPQPLKQSLRALRKANRTLARTKPGSAHRRQAQYRLAHLHANIVHQRQDWHWKLAHDLCHRYDTIYLEDLELRGMVALWGRKMTDLSYGGFLQTLHQVAARHANHVHYIDRWFPSTKLCHVCGNLNAFITLRDRVWTCACGAVHHRDRNAAINIYQEGASSCLQGRCKPTSVAVTT